MTEHYNVNPSAVAEALVQFELGLNAHQQRQIAIAQDYYANALALDPNQFEALHLSGLLAYQMGDLEHSRALIQSAIAINPLDAIAHSNYGNTLFALQCHTEALAAYESALTIDPLNGDTHFNKANTLQALARYQEAISAFDQSLLLNPQDADAHFNRANTLRSLQRYEEALQSFNLSIQLRPEYTSAAINRGITLLDLKRANEAIESFKFAILIEPNNAEAYLNYGNALRSLDRPEDALVCYEKAIALKPSSVEAHNNQGSTLEILHRYNEALASFSNAIAINPNSASSHWNRSLCNLRIGNYKEGWLEYEWRWQLEQFTSPIRNFRQKLWLGKESLQNKTILLHGEQGFGDNIQFCRYVPLVKLLGAKVILEVDTSLVELMHTLYGADQIIATNKQLPEFDYHCPLLSLPLAFDTTLDTIPQAIPYLSSDSRKVELWKKLLRHTPKRRIGIAWKGRQTPGNTKRTIELSKFIMLLPTEYEYISLQTEFDIKELNILQKNLNIQNVAELINDFSDTAAICQLMDAIVCVDTSVAHLACALGKPTWILLPENSDWRWGLSDRKNYWYPNVNLIRIANLCQKTIYKSISEYFKIKKSVRL